MTDQELKDLVASLAVSQNRTDSQLAKTIATVDGLGARVDRISAATEHLDARMDKAAATVESVGKQLGGIGRNQGDVAEEFFYNSLSEKPQLGSIVFDNVVANMEAGRPGHQAEFDIVLNNGASVAVIEVKYKVHPSDLEHAQDNLARYRAMFPQQKEFKLYGGVAGFSISPKVVELAKEKGLFVLKRKGDVFSTDTSGMKTF